ncbi:lipocalin family protein [Anaerosacchariphilus polymeriproducens]|uniref:Lipocalin-like domain-containing protein n=1 Tax=Anaerosacchariphilus polymeriproducens TaxID=1812858 RepID=A0A371AT20_9FIRM|nr:lipocalin family protein [Anaerosacchariphilus polymeriproducens]RDU22724.1 hypothetical protein DWV06_13215 [Anaerosacchariphilus polymeriproducens]
MKKGFRILFFIFIVGIMSLTGCTGQKKVEEKTSIVGKWVSSAIQMEGNEVKLDPDEDEDMMISIEFEKEGKYKLNYDGSTKTGSWIQNGNKITLENIDKVEIDIELVKEKLNLSIIEEPQVTDKNPVWICEKQK